jgi:UDP-N-acetylmuramoyl-tripeptide--D-alanyl-D-alanine ligase
MVLWRANEAAAVTGGAASRDFGVTGVSADLGHLAAREMFVALNPGDARAALDAGAGAILATHIPADCSAQDPFLIVPDLTAALIALAGLSRSKMSARVVAVGGALGKSTALAMLATALKPCGSIETVEANTLTGFALRLAHLGALGGVLIVEFDPKDPADLMPMAELLRADFLLLTPVPSSYGPALAKTANLTIAPCCDDDASGYPPSAIRYGTSAACSPRLVESRLVNDTTIIQAISGPDVTTPFLMKIRHPAPQIGVLALGVLALAHSCGADWAIAALDLGLWEPAEGQGARDRIYMDILDAGASFDLFDVASEPNARLQALSSDLATLRAARPRDGLGRLRRGRRIAFIGGADPLPIELAQDPVLARIDRVHCFGAGGLSLWQAITDAKRGEWRGAAADLLERIPHLIDAGDVVMVRGSEGSGADQVVDALRNLGQLGAAEAHALR